MRIDEGCWEAVLRDEERIEIRAAKPQDRDLVRAFFEHLSEDSRWLRFHSPMPVVRSWMVDTIVNADHDSRAALIALHDARIVGVAEWGREQPDAGTADVAIVVDESFRRRGIAQELVRHLAADARSHGVAQFSASVLSVNRPTISLIQHVAPTRTTAFDGPTVEVRIPLGVTA